MRTMQTLAASIVVALVAATAAQAVTFTEVTRFDVDFAFAANIGEQDPPDPDNNPKYIGTNPLGVAWNGSDLYLAGFDNFGSSLLPIGLIEAAGVGSLTGEVTLGDIDFSSAFGQIFQPSGRGYTGIDLQGNRLAAAYDNGSATANGIQVFDTTTNTLLWDLSDASTTGRGGSGIAFDPGFPGGDPASGAGVAWTQFGSGRRALNDTETGAVIWQLDDSFPETLGMQWLSDDPVDGNFARDMAFDPDTGDVYVRRSNDIDAADRTGDNATDNRRTIVDAANGDFVIGGKIEFIPDTTSGDVLIYNDSPSSSLGQTFDAVINVVDTDGVAQTPTFSLLNGETTGDLLTGNGVYDFDYDASTGTLALLDFTNRNVHIFDVSTSGGGLMADFNGDGSVDLLDLDILGTNFGLDPATMAEGDANGDGVVDLLDLDILGAEFGMMASASIPEPTALVLLAAAAGMMTRRSRG